MRKKGEMSASSQQRMSAGRPLVRSLKVRYLVACRWPEEWRKENIKVWRKLSMTITLKQMSWLKAPWGLRFDLKRL